MMTRISNATDDESNSKVVVDVLKMIEETAKNIKPVV
jgi:hypothetical protein